MGFVELAGSCATFGGPIVSYVSHRERSPNLLVLIGFPEFNLRLAKLAKKLKIPFFTISVRRFGHGDAAGFVRSPDVSIIWPSCFLLKCPFMKNGESRLALSATPSSISFAPESPVKLCSHNSPWMRRSQRSPFYRGWARRNLYHLPVLLDAAFRLSQDSAVQFLVIRASTVDRGELESMLKRVSLRIPIVEDQRYDAVNACDLAWTASGTATVETALLLKPMIIVYRLSWLTYALARMLVNVKHVGMVNIMAGKEVVPELIQADFTAERVVKKTRTLLENRDRRDRIVRKLVSLREKLGTPGAADRVADIAMSMMGKGSKVTI